MLGERGCEQGFGGGGVVLGEQDVSEGRGYGGVVRIGGGGEVPAIGLLGGGEVGGSDGDLVS